MNSALKYLGTLPDKTIVYNGHEYTTGNLAFTKSVDPDGAGTARLKELVKNNGVTTGISSIGDEKEWNVFMRLDSPTIRWRCPSTYPLIPNNNLPLTEKQRMPDLIHQMTW